MEDIQKKKGNTGLIVFFMILLLVLLGCLGFGAYKYMGVDSGSRYGSFYDCDF